MRGARPFAALEAAVGEAVAARSGEVLVAAVSGGPDSAALAALLAGCAARAGGTLVLAHVNHGLRRSAWQDEAVALSLGAALGARVVTAALPPGPASEERLRDERYTALATLAARAGGRRVFTAHHARDQAETVLLALFRGTGPDGLAGMPAARAFGDGLELVRPLLEIAPGELAAFADSQHLPYALDPSNADPGYRRNALRLALAELRSSFPDLDAAVARCAAIVRSERAAEPRALLRAELRAALGEAGAGTRDIPFERLDAAARAIERGGTGRLFLRHGVELVVE